MRLLLDEQLPGRLAQILRDRDIDAVAIAEQPDWMGLADDRVLDLGQALSRAVVTNNVKDYRPLAARRILGGTGHHGLILIPGTFRRRKQDLGRLANALEELAKRHPTRNALVNQETWVRAT